MFKALLCKLNLRHEWHVEHTGSLCKHHLRCGKDDDRGGGGAGNFGAWEGPVGG